MKISVIVPMFNEEDNVLRTLSEVNNVLKVYDDYEIIAVDDGSKDQTLRLSKEFSSNNKHVKVVKQPVNMGMVKLLEQDLNMKRRHYSYN